MKIFISTIIFFLLVTSFSCESLTRKNEVVKKYSNIKKKIIKKKLVKQKNLFIKKISHDRYFAKTIAFIPLTSLVVSFFFFFF